MRDIWKFFWDIAAVAIGLYIGWKIFLFSGENIPAFGYFPIGLIVGLLAFGITAYLTHAFELLCSWLLWKLFKIRVAEDLPFGE